MAYNDYEIVMGLETHVELKTNTKIYCGCTTEFGGDPNTHCCPVCIGLPGTLPVLNEKVVEFAIRAGLATNCEIQEYSKQDRKNYFYPDLPKAYQVSQFDLPLCYDGKVDITIDGVKKDIGITRIHIEEDAGKLLHENIPGSLVDYNRGGVPLIEIVSEPDLRSADEVKVYLEKLKTMLKYIDVSDCKMQEGSLRCDVNISVRKHGDAKFGTRTELKNMNSFAYIIKAIGYESKRQIDVIEAGGTITQETRRWDEVRGITESMRGKEEAHDYRYFPEPDLMPIVTTAEKIKSIKDTLPELPEVKKERYISQFGLTPYDANLIADYKNVAKFFETSIDGVKTPKIVANMIIGDIYSRFDTEEEKEDFTIPVSPNQFNELVKIIESGMISNSIGKKVLEEMWETGKAPMQIIEEKGLKQMDNQDELREIVKKVIASNAQAVEEYKGGKEKAFMSLVGGVMKETKGKANPQMVNEVMREELK
ncbi:MAG TPA: Asp-tRNA(Asn)/Glu-tRNA(Gln) amidotransferase GatCAB subunit B [Clostridiales bacterium]|nr:MAG: aspartyl/glutamyl-tRNA amidotransferase subunit B [Clostridiales bacterium GWD2_32_59]HAN10322.1 Asp-tRNA(Asn)/Glu-tRNA(Gln) amidotransferase GatCAB subunit B [Clostridiales bacterium]